MRSFYGKDAFFLKMKKKPDQQEVFDNLDNYTEEELQNLRGTHFPQWVRDALIKLKKNEKSSTTAYDIADRMNKYHKERMQNDLEL